MDVVKPKRVTVKRGDAAGTSMDCGTVQELAPLAMTSAEMCRRTWRIRDNSRTWTCSNGRRFRRETTRMPLSSLSGERAALILSMFCSQRGATWKVWGKALAMLVAGGQASTLSH